MLANRKIRGETSIESYATNFHEWPKSVTSKRDTRISTKQTRFARRREARGQRMNTFRGGRVEGKLIKGFEIEMEVDTYWPQFEISIRLRKYVHVPSFHRFFHAVSFFFFPPPLFCPLLHRFNSRSLTSSTLDREIPTLSLFRVVAGRGRNFHPLHGSPVTILEISPEFLETRAQRSNVLTLARHPVTIISHAATTSSLISDPGISPDLHSVTGRPRLDSSSGYRHGEDYRRDKFANVLNAALLQR